MASFTGVGDNVVLALTYPGEQVDIAISGTYNMTILFQKEVGSKNSGAWQTLRTYTTANATVAEKYYTESFYERVRLIVTVDTSGTATATLTDSSNTQLFTQRGPKGKVLFSINEGGNFVYNKTPVTLTASTTLTRELHANRPVLLSAAAGLTVTMPQSVGLGDEYLIHCIASVTSNNYIIQAASAADVFNGGISLSTDAAGVSLLTAATTDTITMNGSTTGGLVGTWFKFLDITPGVFSLSGFACTSGAEATPFSAAV